MSVRTQIVAGPPTTPQFPLGAVRWYRVIQGGGFVLRTDNGQTLAAKAGDTRVFRNPTKLECAPLNATSTFGTVVALGVIETSEYDDEPFPGPIAAPITRRDVASITVPLASGGNNTFAYVFDVSDLSEVGVYFWNDSPNPRTYSISARNDPATSVPLVTAAGVAAGGRGYLSLGGYDLTTGKYVPVPGRIVVDVSASVGASLNLYVEGR